MILLVFFFKQKTAYWRRISDWSSDVCSSDLLCRPQVREQAQLFPEAQDRLLGPQVPFQPVAIRIAHRAEQDRVRAPGNVQRRLRQRVAARLIGSAADLGRLEDKIPRAGRRKQPSGLADHFWTDSVARTKPDQNTGFPLRLDRKSVV